MREVYDSREIYSRRSAIDAESPANGRRAKTEEEKPGSPLNRAAVRGDDDDDDESAGDEESGEHSRRVENAAGAAEDGGHRRSSAQERNLTPHTKPNAHRDARFKSLVCQFFFLGEKKSAANMVFYEKSVK